MIQQSFVFLFLLLIQSFGLKTNLNGGWRLTIDKCPQGNKLTGKDYNVTIPSTFHLDLLKHDQIEDPFFGNNYPSLHWVSECYITYSTNISFDSHMGQQHIELVFEGIDTYSTISFNDKEVLTTKNAFI